MPVKSIEELRHVGAQIFVSCGAPLREAELVIGELIEANLLGLDSHGVQRITEYVDSVKSGWTIPGAPVTVLKETATTAIVDSGRNFGAVSSRKMVDIALEKAQTQMMAVVTAKRSNHVGRLGAWVQKLADRRMIGLAYANGGKRGHIVTPWGGREGRLNTNPIAYAFPTSGHPVVYDIATSMVPEGKIRVMQKLGKQLPPGSIQKANGEPTTDPNDFYGPPRGTILPFGSELGFKGFGLGLLAEIMSSVLVGEELSEEYNYGNGFTLIAINPEAFCGSDAFVALMDELHRYVVSCPPAAGFTEVLMPGDLEFRTREKRLAEGILLDDETWAEIERAGRFVGCSLFA
ncbi:Ldh family oxidoreductase [Paenibacillus cymbidii]|uniref:Ldh family oxidoreductase n=1 Tax=Paenibacillus cymbidii TaxID=1639034 RepID=UPI00107FE8F2|nr:Ldh family oxidoreductase [Paenibacillus cymbidii]